MRPYVSIIVPAHNEEGNLKKCVSSLTKICKGINYEILIVDDCSKDKTGEIADSLARKYRNIRVVHRQPPNGFGRAIKSGLQASRGDIIIPVMCDLSDDPKTIMKMIKKIEQGYDIVIGSRFIKGGKLVDYPKLKYLAHRAYNTVLGIVFMRNIKDFSNAFKAYRRIVLKDIDIKSDGFEITSEMVLKPIIINGAKIVEVPTVWRNRKSGKAKFKGLLKQGVRYGRVLLECLVMKITR
jgi:glycosyltransferase involved in cell wall biosynthesis